MRKILMAICLLPLMAKATTWYVDAANGSDSYSGLSRSMAKKTIQAAVDIAVNGDSVVVLPGVYAPIETDDKLITISSEKGSGNTVIDGYGAERCFSACALNRRLEDPVGTNTVLRGFKLINAINGTYGGTVDSCVITDCLSRGIGWSVAHNCLVYGNYDGGAVGSMLVNCTIADNSCDSIGAGTYQCCHQNTIVCNNISPWGIDNIFRFEWGEAEEPLLQMTLGLARWEDICVIEEDVGFVNSEIGDYHLSPESHCVDAGSNGVVITDYDLDGNRRISNGTVDIGCYEYQVLQGPYEQTIDGVKWTYMIDSANAIVGSGEGATIPTDTAGSVVVPATLGGKSVKEIAEDAFAMCGELTEVTIPASVTKIRGGAFYRCSKLEKIVFEGDEPSEVLGDPFYRTGATCKIYATHGTKWSVAIPGTWQDLPIVFLPWCDESLSAIPSLADGSTFSFSTSLSLTAKNGCEIFYTRDGSVPTRDSSVYRGALSILETATVKYMVVDMTTGNWSPIGSVTLTRVPAESAAITVTPSVADGTRFVETQYVTLLANGGETIWYTTDGSDPKTSSTRKRYTGSIYMSQSTELKYYGVNSYGDYGMVGSVYYIMRLADGGPYQAVVGGVTWTFAIESGKAIVLGCDQKEGHVTIPAELGGCFVDGLADGLFARRSNISGVTIPNGVTTLGESCFERCVSLTSVTIPASVRTIGYWAFRDCLRLAEVIFLGQRPQIDLGAFMGVPAYAVVSSQTGSVTAVIPTEVAGTVVTIPNGWFDQLATRHQGDLPAGFATYEAAFRAKYGADLAKALACPTGKRDASGQPMCVWQDFVAGTDPLDDEDVFVAKITMVDGVPVVGWTPELPPAEAALRKYTVYGATVLNGEWTDVSDYEPAARLAMGYQFFKVKVEMR